MLLGFFSPRSREQDTAPSSATSETITVTLLRESCMFIFAFLTSLFRRFAVSLFRWDRSVHQLLPPTRRQRFGSAPDARAPWLRCRGSCVARRSNRETSLFPTRNLTV